MKTLNIFGSTGHIGTKSLKIIQTYFPNIKFNLFLANKNYKKLIYQTKKYKPKYIFIADETKYKYIKSELSGYKTKILFKDELKKYLSYSKSDISILCISGFSSLKYLEQIIINTNNLGLVNKESVVAVGNIINKLSKKYNTKIYPLDSEHFSLQNFFNSNSLQKEKKDIHQVLLTASGGPFLYKKTLDIKNASLNEAINHPKWKMGIKNSVDSATLVNKCLEVIEAHYLFDIEYKKLKIIIHPESLVHSIVQFNDFTSCLNYFYHDMFIPLYNFFIDTSERKKININNNKYKMKNNFVLNFYEPDHNKFPILKIFNKLDKKNKANIINFNTGNEYAVNLFAQNKINFGQIIKVIEKSLSFNFKMNLNKINNVLLYQNELIRKLDNYYL